MGEVSQPHIALGHCMSRRYRSGAYYTTNHIGMGGMAEMVVRVVVV